MSNQIFTDWRKHHGEIIKEFLIYLNKRTDSFILKGGTSLMMCYNLNRFSEDIDLDGTHSKQIKSIISNFCQTGGYSYRVAKDTDTVKRFMINYGNAQKPLKIEISYRRKNISQDEYTKINGITVYNINNLCMMKVNAYSARDKIRDLFDLVFICNKYWDKLSSNVVDMVRYCVEAKGIEQFDYLLSTQSDELIDKDTLESEFLIMYDKLGLLMDNLNSEEINDNYYMSVNEKELSILKNSHIHFEYVPDNQNQGHFIVKTSMKERKNIELLLENSSQSQKNKIIR